MNNKINILSKRFRGLLPVVVDVETAGLNPLSNALLEVAAVTLTVKEDGRFSLKETIAFHVEPFAGAKIEKASLEITKIDPTYPLRYAIPEKQALHRLFYKINHSLQESSCYRAILVGHNAWFDLSFLQAATKRANIHDFPFHAFTTIDTATLSAFLYGETVLARATRKARIFFDVNKAHSAIYDAERTAELFCVMMNQAPKLFG